MSIEVRCVQNGVFKSLDIDLAVTKALPTLNEGFYWIDVRTPSDAQLEMLAGVLNLHVLAVEDVKHTRQRPTAEEYDEHLFVVLPWLNMGALVESDQPDAALVADQLAYNITSLYLFCNQRYIVTIQPDQPKGLGVVRARCEKQKELEKLGVGFVLYALIDYVVDGYMPIIDNLEDQVDEIDQVFLPHMSTTQLQHLHVLKRQSMRLKRLSLPLLQAIEKLHGGLAPSICHDLYEYFRDVGDHIQRFDSTVDFLVDSVNSTISLCLTINAQEDSQITKRFAAWAAIIAVPTMMAGIWGMNFMHMPELVLKYGYYVALLSMVAASSTLYVMFKRRQWL